MNDNPISLNFNVQKDKSVAFDMLITDQEVDSKMLDLISGFLVSMEQIDIKQLVNECIYKKYKEFEKDGNINGIKNIESVLMRLNNIYDTYKTEDSSPIISPVQAMHGKEFNLPTFPSGMIKKSLKDFEIKWTPYYIIDTDEDIDEDEIEEEEEVLFDGGEDDPEELDKVVGIIGFPQMIGPQMMPPPISDIKIYTMDTNFDITKPMIGILNSYIDGIEGIKILSRYRLRVMIGKLFDIEDIKAEVRRRLTDYLQYFYKFS